MKDLSQLLTPLSFPAGLDRIQRSFARQPDCQTCGASAIRHGLLLGGLTIPAATLEAILDIRTHEGTSPRTLRTCLRRLGLAPVSVRKPARQSTRSFLDELSDEFGRGAFLLPCIRAAEHWVCVGAWENGRVGVVDSFFDRRRLSTSAVRRRQRSPALAFVALSPEQFDALDWPHHVTLVRPGVWEEQYRAWLAARRVLLRMPVVREADGRPVTVAEAIRESAHQYLDDLDYTYRRLHLCLPGAGAVTVKTDDPGDDAVGVEISGRGCGELVVVRRLGGLLSRRGGVPEAVLRGSAVRVSQLES